MAPRIRYGHGNLIRVGAVAVVAMMMVMGTLVVAVAGEDQAKEKEECTTELAGLSPCLSYVQGSGNSKVAPTPDCCVGLKNVLKASKKCLCLLVKYKDDPRVGIKIDVNRALNLPTVCQAPANISACPDLLHLAPNSPDAKVFYDFGKRLNGNNTTTTTTAANSVADGSSTTPTASHGGTRSLLVPVVVYSSALATLVFAFLIR